MSSKLNRAEFWKELGTSPKEMAEVLIDVGIVKVDDEGHMIDIDLEKLEAEIADYGEGEKAFARNLAAALAQVIYERTGSPQRN